MGNNVYGNKLTSSEDDVTRQHWRSRVGHRDNVMGFGH